MKNVILISLAYLSVVSGYFLQALPDLTQWMTLLMSLFPIIMFLIFISMIASVVYILKSGVNKGKMLGILFLCVFLVGVNVPGALAAEAVSPGSYTTYSSMPVEEKFSGLDTTSTIQYQLLDSNGVTVQSASYADSSGRLTFLVTPDEWGQNTYTFEFSNGTDILTFTITNIDMSIYMVPMAGMLVVMLVFLAIVGVLLKIVKT